MFTHVNSYEDLRVKNSCSSPALFVPRGRFVRKSMPNEPQILARLRASASRKDYRITDSMAASVERPKAALAVMLLERAKDGSRRAG